MLEQGGGSVNKKTSASPKIAKPPKPTFTQKLIEGELRALNITGQQLALNAVEKAIPYVNPYLMRAADWVAGVPRLPSSMSRLPQVLMQYGRSSLPELTPPNLPWSSPVTNFISRASPILRTAGPMVNAALLAGQATKFTADYLNSQGMPNIMTGGGWFQMPKPEQSWRYMSAYR